MPKTRQRKKKSGSGQTVQYITDSRKYLYSIDSLGNEKRNINPTYGQKIKIYHRRVN